jgi:hypothetical protein
MFKELAPYLRQRAVLLTVTHIKDDQIRVNVIPQKLSRNDRAIRVSSSQEVGGESGVRLRVRTWNSAVFSFKTIVRAILDSFRDASQVFSARRWIIGSVSANSTSCSKVSSAEIDWVGRLGTTGFSSMPLANS